MKRVVKVISILLIVVLMRQNIGAQEEEGYSEVLWGHVIEKTSDSLIIRTDKWQIKEDINVLIDENSLFIDAITGKDMTIKEIELYEPVYVYLKSCHQRIESKYDGTVKAIIANIQEGQRAPDFIEVCRVIKEDNEKINIITQNSVIYSIQLSRVTFGRYGVKNEDFVRRRPDIDSIKPGTTLFVWYNLERDIIPPQANIEKCIVNPYPYDGYIEISEEGIYVNDKMYVLKDNIPREQQKGKWVNSLGEKANLLNYKVFWRNNKNQIAMQTRDFKCKMRNVQGLELEDNEAYNLEREMLLKNSGIFVSAKLFQDAFNIRDNKNNKVTIIEVK